MKKMKNLKQNSTMMISRWLTKVLKPKVEEGKERGRPLPRERKMR